MGFGAINQGREGGGLAQRASSRGAAPCPTPLSGSHKGQENGGQGEHPEDKPFHTLCEASVSGQLCSLSCQVFNAPEGHLGVEERSSSKNREQWRMNRGQSPLSTKQENSVP